MGAWQRAKYALRWSRTLRPNAALTGRVVPDSERRGPL